MIMDLHDVLLRMRESGAGRLFDIYVLYVFLVLGHDSVFILNSI